MKVYAITENTLKTGAIEEVEGSIHSSSNDIFLVSQPGELTRFYKRQGDQITTEIPKNYEGFFEKTYQGAILTGVRIVKAIIRKKKAEIRDLEKIRVG